jgi:membrane-bound serine protease (ClpP class)
MKFLVTLLVQIFILLPTVWASATSYPVEEIAVLRINSAITPATYDYLKSQFLKVRPKSLAIIRLNTPGGLVTTTKDIITLIGEQSFPVAVWITPEGASASSAGAIIASAAHFIFMSPGTNIGAATPVGLGEDMKESDGKKKALSDLSAMVRSLSNSRGRPAAPFEKMIKDAESYTDSESLKLRIIDGIVSTDIELKKALNGKKFSYQGKELEITLHPEAQNRELEPTAGQKILEVLANPSTAYFLFLIGVALLYFEFQAPGGFIAGSVGLGFIILAAISFQVLPLNWGALGLIILGAFLFVLEIFVTSYGILTLAGLASFTMGSLFLFHGESGFISVEYPVILSTLAGVVSSLAFLVWYLFNDAKKQKLTHDFFIPGGTQGIVIALKRDQRPYQIKIRGEIWNAECEDDLQLGDHVNILKADPRKLVLQVKKNILS